MYVLHGEHDDDIDQELLPARLVVPSSSFVRESGRPLDRAGFSLHYHGPTVHYKFLRFADRLKKLRDDRGRRKTRCSRRLQRTSR